MSDESAGLKEDIDNALANGVGSLEQALVAAQADMPAVKKDSENDHFKNRFTSLDELITNTRPILNRHGLAITQFPTVHATTGEPVLTTILVHGPSRQRLELVTPLYLRAKDMQAFGSAVTYARRYAWAAMLGIASEEDDDGNTPAEPPTKEAKQATSDPKMITPAQQKKIHAQISEYTKANEPFPNEFPGAESWNEIVKTKSSQDYGVESSKDLTSKEASELIDWLAGLKVPF